MTLTPRECQVLALIAAGDTSHTAARRLGCRPRTIDKHLQHVYRKLHTTNRVSAVMTASRLGLLAR